MLIFFYFLLRLDLGVFHIGKRTGYFVHWEPIYIGTHADPHYDERLSWEGKSDKMTQVRAYFIHPVILVARYYLSAGLLPRLLNGLFHSRAMLCVH